MATLSKNGTTYTLSGPSDAPVVALIHGLGLNRHTWREHVPALSQRYRVLNYDLYGHGESVAPPVTASLTLFAQQLRELCDELRIDQCALVGFSLGGMINRRFAMDYSQRASALAILNSPHERDPAAQKLVEERASQTTAGGAAATIDSTLERWFTADFLATRTDLVNEIRDWVLGNDPASYVQCRWVLANGVIELIHPQPPITTPSLVITCENDSGSTPAMAMAIAAEIGDAQTLIVPALQHMGLVERPDVFVNAVLGFLDETLA